MGDIPKSWACEVEFTLQEGTGTCLIKVQTCTTAFLTCLTCDLLTQCHQFKVYHFCVSQNPCYRKQIRLHPPTENQKPKKKATQNLITNAPTHTVFRYQEKEKVQGQADKSKNQIANLLESQNTNKYKSSSNHSLE